MLFRSFSLKGKLQPEARQAGEPFLPVLSAEHVIHAYELSQSITTIKQLVAVTDKHFELYYNAPIDECLMLTQYLGTDFVQERFAAVIRGLKLRRPLLLPTGVESESIRKSKDLWTYITFIALLLYGIGPVVLGKIIIFKNSLNDKNPARRWHPLIALLQPPQVYRVIGEQAVTRYSNAYFLHRILNDSCRHWITQDVKAFNAIAELLVDPNPNSLLGALLLKAHEVCSSASSSLERPNKPITTDAYTDDNRSAEQAHSGGEAFYDWLQKYIKTLSPSTFEPNCFNTSNGLTLVCPDIFKYYASTQGGTWKDIQNDFLQLKRHSPNPKNNSDYHTLTIPGRGNVNTLILPGLSINPR